MDHPIFSDKIHSLSEKIAVARSMPPNERSLLPHTNAVKRCAMNLAEQLNHSAVEVSLIRISSILHDIGKFEPSVRPLFFEVKGQYTPQQTKKAKAHALLSSYKIMRDWEKWETMDLQRWMVFPIVVIVAEHHLYYCESAQRHNLILKQGEFESFREKNPCPDDLVSFALVAGRILKVADHFMTRIRGRHYMAPVSPHEAYAEIASGAWEQFDPRVVLALEKMLDSGSFRSLGSISN